MKQTLDVVMPVYNGEKYIKSATESILRQQQHIFNTHIIAVDDGSSDNSVAVLQALADQYKNITVIKLAQNQGIAAARNAGIQAASGDWLSFIDQDDAWDLRKLDLQYRYLQAHPHCDFVLAHQRMELCPGVTRPAWVKPEWLTQPQKGFLMGEILIKREVFLQADLLDDSLRWGGDDVQWFIAAKDAGLRYEIMSEVLLYRKIHQKNHSTHTQHGNKELLKIIRNKIQRELKKPLFSVIIPCYNSEKTIEEAVYSVLSQLSENDELIIVDDGSADDSVDIIKSIADSRIRLVCNNDNKGIAASRNIGLSLVMGDYIAFLDSDDIWPNGRQAKVVDAIQSQQPDIVSGMVKHFYCQSALEEVAQQYKLPDTQQSIMPGTCVFRKACIQYAGFFDASLKVGEFIDWMSQMQTHKPKAITIDSVVLLRRIHGNNHTLLNRDSQNDYLKVVRKHLARQA